MILQPHIPASSSRREFLSRAGGGLGGLALAAIMNRSAAASDHPAAVNPMTPRPGRLPGRATSVIWCFIDGGPSHIDLFDPKPKLNELAGKPLPPSFKRPVTAMGVTAHTPLLASKRTFRRHGQGGTWVSDWLPEIATCVDDICVVRSCTADAQTHVNAVCQMNSGAVLGGRPCVGSWAIYGLGSECDDLPGFVVFTDYLEPPGGTRNWSAGFMPTMYQGTVFGQSKSPVLYVRPRDDRPVDQQRAKIDFIQDLNARYAARRADDDRLEARIASYELAFRMQSAAPGVADLTDETEETTRLYGLDREDTARNGRNCLLARRLVERGVRFVQVYMGSGTRWDAHSDMEGNHTRYCRESDRPIAGLVKDLKRRGMLDSTLVIWGGEFGRTPMSESGDGRDHNPFGFTMWFAGGGVRGGITYGTTDEIGLYAIENKAHIHDIHATILYLLGLDHERVTYAHNGRDERLTITSGRVVHDIVA